MTNLFSSLLLLNIFTCVVKAFSSNGNFTAQPVDESSIPIEQKCLKAEHSINTSGDLLAISDCAVIIGSIHITGYDSNLLSFGSITEVHGDLTVKNVSSLLRIEGLSLRSIGGTFELNTLNSLTTLSFPKLEAVQAIKWQVLPILTYVNFDSGIQSIKSVIMTDTSLTGFGGFNVDTLKKLYINNNRFLEKIESTVSEVTDELLIAANSRNIKVFLPNLKQVKSMTIKDTEFLDIESLEVIEKSADFSNNRFTALKAPELKSTGDTLSIINNKNLDNVEFGSLTEVGGGLMIIDNEKVKKINFFPSLKTVGGAIEFQGDISENHFKELRIIKGSAIMKSSSEQFDCSEWMKNEVGKVVRGGKVECGSGKSTSTKVMLVDEDGESTDGDPGINDVTKKNSSNRDAISKQKSGANRIPFIGNIAIVLIAHVCGFLVQML